MQQEATYLQPVLSNCVTTGYEWQQTDTGWANVESTDYMIT